jgi:KipI family sensor histidine kinase inhibitor
MNPTGRLYGDRAVLIDVDDVTTAHQVAGALERAVDAGRAPGAIEATDVVVGARSVALLLVAPPDDPEPLLAWIAFLIAELPTGRRLTSSGRSPFDIPVVFDGADLDGVAERLGTTTDAVIELLINADLLVAFLGFAPGFPYLTGLPPELAALPRLDRPRSSVPSGSVAVAGGFASVYPNSSPGGWLLLGHTERTLFDSDRAPYSLLAAGDRVRFSVAPGGQSRRGAAPTPAVEGGSPRQPRIDHADRLVIVEDPGLQSTVQDGGRLGVAAIGVPRAGPADPSAMALANRLMGNPDDTAALEMTAVGPTLRFTAPAHVAVVGSTSGAVVASVDGHPVGDGTVWPIKAGQRVAIGTIGSGLRAYLAVAGGFATPTVVGSQSSDLLTGLGGGPLITGDQLALGPPGRPRGMLASRPGVDEQTTPTAIRIIEGPHPSSAEAWTALVSGCWTVADDSNRIGLRLERGGGSPKLAAPAVDSLPMVTGAIQVPPNGSPIVLLADHATVGGYPVLASVISADLALLGQLGPGSTLCFVEVDWPTARSAWRDHCHHLDALVSGWYPTAAGT